MKMTLVVAAALLLTACVPSIEPLYKKGEAVRDARFAGTWTIQNGKMVVEPGEDAGYKVEYDVAEGKPIHLKFIAHLVKLGSTTFVDLFPEMSDQLPCYPCVPMHMFGKVAVNGSSLKIDLLDTGWLETIAKAGKLQTPSALIEDLRIFTAKTAELQAFMLKHENDPNAFLKGDPWTKGQ